MPGFSLFFIFYSAILGSTADLTSQTNESSYEGWPINTDKYLLVKLGRPVAQLIDTPEKLLEAAADISEVRNAPDKCLPNPGVPAKSEWYPSYHLAPPTGWMNDPNGLIHFGGYYHAFYQHNPYAPKPEQIHWGHARSKNMVDWEHLPIALAPSIEEDKFGCFSGSAVDNNGTLTLFYTGNGDIQVQCLATSNDTINFTKEGKILDAPKGVPNFRDPKVFRDGDSWYMVVGASVGDQGEVRLYKSNDLHHWEQDGVLAKANKDLGYMWECPDFFPLGADKHVLVTSPQGITPDGYNYRNLYQSGHFVGVWNPGEPFQIEQNFTLIDNGHDFYAPQTFLAPGERRIMLAWMSMWESPIPEKAQGWGGMLTLPRVLSLEDGEVLVKPISEVEQLRSNPKFLGATVLNNEHLQLDSDVFALEIITNWSLNSSNAEKYGLRLGDAGKSEEGLFLYIDNQAQRLTLDRRYPQYGLTGYRSVAIPQVNFLSLRVFFDHSSVEVFVNDGMACMSSRIYPQHNQRYLSLYAENGKATLESSFYWAMGHES